MKKKTLALVMVLLVIVSAFAACSKGGDNSSSNSQPSAGSQPQSSSNPSSTPAAGVDLQAIVDKINEEIGIAMPTEMDEEMLVQAFNLNADDFEQVAAVGTMVNTKVNNVVLVKAKEGKADAVKASLEAKLEQLTKTFETYLQDQYEVAKAGKVVVNGDYVALLVLEDIVGEGAKTPAEAVAAAEKIFMDATSAK